MFKIFALIIAAAAGVMWLRVKKSNFSAKNASKKIIKHLDKGKLDFASLAESLGMMIRSKMMSPGFTAFNFYQQLESLRNKKLLGKFTISRVERNTGNDCVIIAEAVTKDIIPGYHENKEVDVVYPCWIYIQLNEAERKIDFKSSFPQDKEHQYLLEDLCDEIYKHCAAADIRA